MDGLRDQGGIKKHGGEITMLMIVLGPMSFSHWITDASHLKKLKLKVLFFSYLGSLGFLNH